MGKAKVLSKVKVKAKVQGKRRLYWIIYQSKTKHVEWGVWAAGMYNAQQAEKLLVAAAKLWGKRRVRIMVCEEEMQRKLLKNNQLQEEAKK
jgi:hypothetical protein